MTTYELANTILQGVGVGVLCVYTWLTYRMAKTAKENTDLTREMQRETSFPNIALSLEGTPVSPPTMNSLETLFILHNTSKYNAKVWVTVDVRVAGQLFDWASISERKYSGIDPWGVPALLKVQGHFNFGRIYQSMAASRSAARAGHRVDPLEICVKYKWTDLAGTRIEEGMEQRWHYDFFAWVWVLDI